MKIDDMRYILAFGFAIILDALDIVAMPIFGLPILGDFADAIGVIGLGVLLGKPTVGISFLEFVPGADIIPFHTFSVIVTKLIYK